jgi:hypothetical protein
MALQLFYGMDLQNPKSVSRNFIMYGREIGWNERHDTPVLTAKRWQLTKKKAHSFVSAIKCGTYRLKLMTKTSRLAHKVCKIATPTYNKISADDLPFLSMTGNLTT